MSGWLRGFRLNVVLLSECFASVCCFGSTSSGFRGGYSVTLCVRYLTGFAGFGPLFRLVVVSVYRYWDALVVFVFFRGFFVNIDHFGDFVGIFMYVWFRVVLVVSRGTRVASCNLSLWLLVLRFGGEVLLFVVLGWFSWFRARFFVAFERVFLVGSLGGGFRRFSRVLRGYSRGFGGSGSSFRGFSWVLMGFR